MELTHSFTVPGTPEQTWAGFQDIASLAECFPGAQVTSVEGDTFEGTVKVKLGPIALVYTGSGAFASKDEAAHTLVVEAKGRDKRGNGTAGATVTVTMTAGSGDAAVTTDVSVRTDLSITGKPAQFGRGVMQDVSDKLLGQFVACLEQRSGVQEPASPVVEPASAVAEPPEPLGEGVSRPPDHGDGAGVSTPSAPDGLAARPTVLDSPPPAGDALNLGATLLPVLVRGYWKQALAAVAVVVVLVRVLRRLGR